MKIIINSMMIFVSIVIVFVLLSITSLTERIISFENVVAQQNSDNNTELGGDSELGADTGMTESDLGGEDLGTTVSDLENDTKVPTNNQTD